MIGGKYREEDVGGGGGGGLREAYIKMWRGMGKD